MDRLCLIDGEEELNVDFIPMTTISHSTHAMVYNEDHLRETQCIPKRPKRSKSKYERYQTVSDSGEDENSDQLDSEMITNPRFEDEEEETDIHQQYNNDTLKLYRTQSVVRMSRWKKWKRRICESWEDYASNCCCQSHGCRCKQSTCFSFNNQKGLTLLQMAGDKLLHHLLKVQIFMSVLSMILSAMVFFPLGLNTYNFDGQCLLFSSIKLMCNRNRSVSVNLEKTVYGEEDHCNYTTFLSVSIAIASLMFVWFFLHNKDMSSLEDEISEVRLQAPVLIVHFILLICVIVSSFKISLGFQVWCDNIIRLNSKLCGYHRTDCKAFQAFEWIPTDRSNFYTYSLIAEISTWFLTLVVSIQCMLAALKLYKNFKSSYEETEIPHDRLEESSEFEEEENKNWSSEENLLETGVAPVPRYHIEYKDHVVIEATIHEVTIKGKKSNADLLQAEPDSPLVLDVEKMKSSKQKNSGVKKKGKRKEKGTTGASAIEDPDTEQGKFGKWDIGDWPEDSDRDKPEYSENETWNNLSGRQSVESSTDKDLSDSENQVNGDSQVDDKETEDLEDSAATETDRNKR